MTLQAMRQHIGAVIYHARRAIEEAPRQTDVPPIIVELAGPIPEELRAAGVDEGHLREHTL